MTEKKFEKQLWTQIKLGIAGFGVVIIHQIVNENVVILSSYVTK